MERFDSIAAATAYFQGHVLLVEPTSIRLGDVRANQMITTTVTFTNLTGGVVKVQGASRDCKCVVVDRLPLRVAPGQAEKLRIELATPATSGEPFRYTVQFYIDRPSPPVWVSLNGRVGASVNAASPPVGQVTASAQIH